MADKIITGAFGDIKYHDNGDGTYSEVVYTSGGGGGGGAATVADGADVAQGATTDAVVAAGAAGTLSAKLRRLTTDLDSVKTNTANNATTTKQDVGNTSVGNVDTNIGAKADSAATTDTGTFSLIALAKRLLQGITSIVTNTGTAATSANQTNGTQQGKVTDGTNVANTLKSDGTAAGQNSIIAASAYLSVNFTTITAQTVAAQDVGNYRWVSVQVNAQGTSSNTGWQGSNDNTNWFGVNLMSAAGGTQASSSSTGSTGIFHGPLGFRYFRINVSGISAGTTSGTVVFSSSPTMMAGIGGTMSQTGTWTVGSNAATGAAVPANAHYMAGINASGNLTGLATIDRLGDASTGTAALANGALSYNGTTYDRYRGNTTGIVVAAGATTTQTVSLSTYNASKAVIILNVSAFTSGTITMSVNGVTASGYVYPILATAAILTTGVTSLRIFPSATPAVNAAANDIVPRTLQIVTTGTFTLTYGIDFELSV